jgi:hypothetical protein
LFNDPGNDDRLRRARPGDYLQVDRDLDDDPSHSAMFLAYDESTGVVISLNGNIGGDADNDWDPFSGDHRQGSDEIAMREDSPDEILAIGRLNASLL